MARVYMICGKICSGKTTYANKLRKDKKAILLSCDEIMLALFEPHLSDFDEVSARVEQYLLQKTVEIIETGIDVILDWGFWRAVNRVRIREFFSQRGIDSELWYLDVADSEWKARVEKRNAAVEAGLVSAYYVDEGLAKKFESRFEKPLPSEIDRVISI